MAPSSCPDPDLPVVNRVLAGDREAYRILVDRYQRQLMRLGYRFHRSDDDVQDFVQEVFLKCFERLAQFRRSGRFYSWLMRIAYNHGMDRIGKRRPEICSEAMDSPDASADPERQALQALACRELRDAVSRLPAQVAACIDLFFFFDLTYAEVSRATGLPVNTVKSHVYRAKLRLRGRLSGTVAEAHHEL